MLAGIRNLVAQLEGGKQQAKAKATAMVLATNNI